MNIFYSPLPNYCYVPTCKYNIDKINKYVVKHINHIGIKMYKPSYHNYVGFNDELTDDSIIKYINMNNNNIDSIMSTTEKLFYTRYTETLVESHLFN